MAKNKGTIWNAVASMALAALALTAFAAAGKLGVLKALPNLNFSADGWFTVADLDGAWDCAAAVSVNLSERRGTIWSGGFWSKDGDLHIIRPGRYALSGQLEGGVVVRVGGNDKVWILLDGADIHNPDNAAFRVEQAGKVFLTLAPDRENSFSDGGKYGEETIRGGVDGVLYARDDLTINGSGSLRVTSEAGHGIVCHDDFVLAGGNVSVTAARDGVHAHDSARFTGMNLTIDARYDGISVFNERKTGYVYVKDGFISIPSCYEGIEAVRVLIDGGDIDIHPRDDGINAPGWSDADDIRIRSGTLQIVNNNGRDADGFDSNRDVHIEGGQIRISVPNDGRSNGIDFGSESGGILEINGGSVIACGSAGMVERASASSAQPSILFNFSPTAMAESQVILLDTAEKEILRWDKVPLAFNSVLLSSPEMKAGESYKLIIGDRQTEIKTSVNANRKKNQEANSNTGESSFEESEMQINWSAYGDVEPPVPVRVEQLIDIILYVSILLACITFILTCLYRSNSENLDFRQSIR